MIPEQQAYVICWVWSLVDPDIQLFGGHQSRHSAGGPI